MLKPPKFIMNPFRDFIWPCNKNMEVHITHQHEAFRLPLYITVGYAD